MVSIASISQQIWDMKYRLKSPAQGNIPGEPVDKTIEDTWRRVATALAAPERDPAKWAECFYEAISDFKFLPAGRVVAGAGSARDVTLFNCFVMGAIPDDMGGIFAHLREAALTMQQGGGIGYDFSTLRPKGTLVKGVGADASGPLSFMDVWDAMCRTIMSAGYRRGAMMATLRCDHPDIEAFVEAKREPGRLRMFNLSVLVTDAFMRAVEQDVSWELTFNGSVHKSLPARDLWDKIMRATYAYAEPGVIFIDRINQRNPLYYCEEIRSTNPCGEQPLPPYGACLLGSLNLARFVDEPFTPKARLDTARLAAIIPDVVRMMDNVIDISRFPLPKQKAEALQKRRIGLGITGLADALILCGLRYGSKEAIAATETWLGLIEREAYLASAALAAEKSPFPLFDKDKYLAGETIAALDDEVKAAIAKHGIRNSLLTSVAPTGTISLFADNVSSGIEPVFSYRYTRNMLMPDGSRREEEVSDYAYRLFRRLKGETAPLPDYFVDVEALSPEDHLVMQAAVQRHIDSSISKTINLPADIAFDDFKDIYARAYAMGCKGCTTYRPNEVTGAVLEARPELPAARPEQAELPLPAPSAAAKPVDRYEAGGVVYMSQPLSRPEALPGQTYKINWPESEHAMYITVNDVVQDGRRRPFEIFINSKNMEHYAWTVALTRMISAVFRRGGDVSFVVEEMKAVFDPRGGAWMEGRYVPSLLAAIGDVIERHMIEIGFLPSRDRSQHVHTAQVVNLTPPPSGALMGPRLRQCPKCGQAALIRSEGCNQCTNCDYSKCGVEREPAMTPLSGIADWVVAAGLAGESEAALLDGFCRRALSAGLKLARAAVIIDTLHPVHEGRAFRWRREETGEPELVEYGSTSEGEAAASWRSSVFYHLLQTGGSKLRAPIVPGRPSAFPQVDAFAAEGMSEYLGLINRFAHDGAIGEMDCVYSYWITDRPGGFADDEIAGLIGLTPALALAVKCASLTRIAGTLVETYLGRDPGRRVLGGRIGRGAAERINAVLWYSDLRGFTRITDNTPPSQIIALLNDYAEAAIGAIHDHGGDVLKLIGDGLLAIFPYAADPAGACTGAIAAEAALRRRLAKLNEKRAAKAQPTTEIYLGLHIGEVFYGNIGSRERLDFTVIGPAVNEASRIAAMCRSAERDVLLSADFAAAVTAAGAASPVSVGRYALRGVSRPQELFTLDRQLGN